MRIAYVSLHWPRTILSGVGKKIQRQIDTWRAEGHQARLFMHTLQRDLEAPLLPGEGFFYRSGGVAAEWDRIRAARLMVESINRYRPEIIYLRYGMYVYPIHRLAAIAPLVEELNTNDLAQHRRLGRAYWLYNRFTRGILIRRTSGLVCLSRELARAPQNVKYRKPTRVVGDGIDLEDILPLPAPGNAQPRMAFIGSPDAPWQGVDKLVHLARAFPDLSVHIIGYDRIEGYETLPENLQLYGYLAIVKYREVLGTMDCAIGSLGLHRISLNESSPLKTRECLAFGLPMVLPYKDTDLHGLGCDFLLEIPNNEENIRTHGQAIHDFAYHMLGKRVNRAQIAMLDQTLKERERLGFFEEILTGRS